jgi:hypothetical protein
MLPSGILAYRDRSHIYRYTFFRTFVRLLKLSHPSQVLANSPQPHDSLLEKLTDQALPLLRQILQLILHVVAIARIPMHAVRVTLDILSSSTSSTSRMTLSTTLTTRAALNKVINITTAPPALSTAHEWATVSPANTHEPRLPAFPACLRIRCVEHAPDLWASGSVDEHKVAVARTIRRTIVAAGLEKGPVRFAPRLRVERVSACPV